MAEDILESKTIPALMEAVKTVYGIEVPTIGEDSPLSGIWKIPITVTAGSPPDPNYTATGAIDSEFPFGFIKVVSPPPDVKVKTQIDIFEAAPERLNTRGIKATVFRVPISAEHPNGVVVKRGLTFVERDGKKVPEEAVVPPEAKVQEP